MLRNNQHKIKLESTQRVQTSAEADHIMHLLAKSQHDDGQNALLTDTQLELNSLQYAVQFPEQ